MLAGGRAFRLGGVAKPLLEIGGEPLLRTTVEAVRSYGAAPIVVVGPKLLPDPEIVWVREDPPFGGPVAAVVAALAVTTAPRVLLLASDMPRAADVVRRLGVELPSGPAVQRSDGAVLVDRSGREQWLAGLYRVAPLRAAIGALVDPTGCAMSTLASALRLMRIPDPEGIAADIDTPAELEEWRGRAHGRRLESPR